MGLDTNFDTTQKQIHIIILKIKCIQIHFKTIIIILIIIIIKHII